MTQSQTIAGLMEGVWQKDSLAFLGFNDAMEEYGIPFRLKKRGIYQQCYAAHRLLVVAGVMAEADSPLIRVGEEVREKILQMAKQSIKPIGNGYVFRETPLTLISMARKFRLVYLFGKYKVYPRKVSLSHGTVSVTFPGIPGNEEANNNTVKVLTEMLNRIFPSGGYEQWKVDYWR
jgi:hypothetical protein